MSEKDSIREMVMALARGDHKTAQAAATVVISAKTKRITESAMADVEEVEEVDEDGDSENLEEGNPLMRAARRHARAGGRHFRRQRDMSRDMHKRDGVREAGYAEKYNRDGYKMHEDGHFYGRNGRMMRSDGYDMHEDGHYYNEDGYRMPDGGYNKARYDDEEHATQGRDRRQGRRQDASMKRRRPRRSAMHEKSDTGADSATVKGKHDHEKMDGDKPDVVKDKGKSAGKDGGSAGSRGGDDKNVDLTDHRGEKPNAIKDKGKSAPSSKTHEEE